MITKKLATLLAAGAFVAPQLLAVPAPLPPGSSTAPPVGVVAGASVGTLSDSFANSLYSGEVDSAVYSGNPANPFGGLTFVYQVELDPNVAGNEEENVRRFSGFPFTDFLTAVEQEPVLGGQASILATRTADGSTVGFEFSVLGDTFNEGEVSYFLIVHTDATLFRTGIGAVINGASSNMDILVPAVTPVPDGGTTAMLLGLGVIGLAGIRRKLS